MLLLYLSQICCAGTDDAHISDIRTQKQTTHSITATPPSAQHIILVIGDGMQLAHEHAASRYLYGADNGLIWHSFSVQAYVTTWDVDTYNRFAWHRQQPPFDPATAIHQLGYDPEQGGTAPYPIDPACHDTYFLRKLPEYGHDNDGLTIPATDSAAAATAMATGMKTDSGKIAWRTNTDSDGQLITIAELMRSRKNAAIGIVSTVPFSHATPAAFVSHNIHRYNYYTGYNGYSGLGIADEIITLTKPEVVIGGGHPAYSNPLWKADKGFISQQLYTTLVHSNEYIFVERKANRNGATVLKEAAERAAANGKKLFGLFGGETGYFDGAMAKHQPDTPVIEHSHGENPALSDAVGAALTVLSADNDGFFLLVEQGDIDWANHQNDYRWMVTAVTDLERAVQAIIAYVDRPDDALDWSNTLLIVTTDHANSYMRFKDEDKLVAGSLPRQERDCDSWTYPDGEITYATYTHTNEPVTLYATGSAACLFNQYKGNRYGDDMIIDNTDIYRVIREATHLNTE